MIEAKVVSQTAQRDAWKAVRAKLIACDDLDAPEIGATISISGEITCAPGDVIVASGVWKTHLKYGAQYQATAVALNFAADDHATLRCWLERELGLREARAILSSHDLASVHAALTGSPDDLTRVFGSRSDQIRALFDAASSSIDALEIAQKLPIPESKRAEILRAYGATLKATLASDPYQLREHLSWREVDRVALEHSKIAADDPRRARGAADMALDHIAQEGHTIAEVAEACGHGSTHAAKAIAKAGIPADLIASGLPRPREDGRVEIAALCTRERQAAQKIRAILEAERHNLACPIALADRYSDEQAFAITLALASGVTVMTGGPGTGKTHTARGIAEAFIACGKRILLAAPTGKAAQRMTEAIGVSATTIHRMLGYAPQSGGWKHNAAAPLDADVIMIDETSMLDVPLFAAVLDAVPCAAQLVLIGDVDQLSSIGPGAILRDLIASEIVPTARLTRIYRQASESAIPHVARAIRDGLAPEIGDEDRGVLLVPIDSEERIADLIVEAFVARMALPHATHRPFVREEVTVISPQRVGVLGTEELNRRIQAEVNPGAGGVFVGAGGCVRNGDRVIHKKNNYKLRNTNGAEVGVVNGEIGIVTHADFGNRTQTILVNFGGEKVIVYPKESVRELQLAYALTVHSTQGSQFPCVIMPIHAMHTWMLTRALLYTGITRASEFALLIGDPTMLGKAARNTHGSQRQTTLAEALRGCA